MTTSEALVFPAVVDCLANNAALIAFIPHTDGKARVFDQNTLENQVFPYLVIGGTTFVPHDVFGKLGQEYTVTIHGWSSKSGKLELVQMHNLVHTALNRFDASITGHHWIYCLLEFSELLEEHDRNIDLMHKVERYRILTREV